MTVDKESTCNTQEVWRHEFNPWAREDALEKEMATPSCILAWKIPWTGEAGRLQSLRSQRVRHDWAHERTEVIVWRLDIWAGATPPAPVRYPQPVGLASITHCWPAPLMSITITLQCWRPGFNSWVGKIPWRREWLSTPVFLPGEFCGQSQ